ncbi:MAG TPA: glycosyltransferase [Verrucomicrobiae bacterium]|nr:glycosyltransferase [Verrucomicrobiae bacterium]
MELIFEIVVVDGASYDGCGEMLAREFPEVGFVQCEKNVGFARANNIGFQQARGECLLFLNPDTEIIGNAIMRDQAGLKQHPEFLSCAA